MLAVKALFYCRVEPRDWTSAASRAYMCSHAAGVEGGLSSVEGVRVVVFGRVDTITARGAWHTFLVGSSVGRLQIWFLSKHG